MSFTIQGALRKDVLRNSFLTCPCPSPSEIRTWSDSDTDSLKKTYATIPLLTQKLFPREFRSVENLFIT